MDIFLLLLFLQSLSLRLTGHQTFVNYQELKQPRRGGQRKHHLAPVQVEVGDPRQVRYPPPPHRPLKITFRLHFKLYSQYRPYSISFNLPNAGKVLFSGLNSKGPCQSLEKGIKIVVLRSGTPQNVKLGRFTSQSYNVMVNNLLSDSLRQLSSLTALTDNDQLK